MSRSSLLACVLLLLGCGGGTALLRTWSEPVSSASPVGRLAVLGMSPHPQVRATFEETFVSQLRERGIDAVEAHRLAAEPEADRASLQALVAEQALDAVLTAVALPVDPQSGEALLPTPYRPQRGGDLYEHVLRTRRELPPEGVVRPDQPLIWVETRLYRTEDARLLWAGIARSQANQDLEAFCRDHGRALIFQLEALRLLP
jgi:hypothetical protein